jgi:uncharacterized protein (DUF302 family)
MLVRTSPHSVPETVDRLQDLLAQTGVEVYARIDHAAGARRAGRELPEQQVLVFGDDRISTQLLEQDPTVGLELPLRILVWDDGGVTRVGYLDPKGLAREYRLDDRAVVLERIRTVLQALVDEATSA